MALLAGLGNPILTTSANLEDTEPPAEAYVVQESWGKLIDIVIDGGLVYPEPSTVVSLVGDRPEVLREGKGDLGKF
jgi:tRNA A37 threonylcarbamoyladenosine synthetase subunit TsaC/SUA5/YrdC